MSVLTRGRNFLLGVGVLYAAMIALLLHPTIQREVFYLNSIRFPWLVDLTRPEASGFDAQRSRSLFLESGAHCWYIQPREYTKATNVESLKDWADISRDDRIIIYLHGTAGTIAVPHRLTTYRILSSLPRTHVLAVDYKGFGLAKGKPSEAGLIEDGVAAVDWAIAQGFHADQVILFGQSLGSAVAFGTALALATRSADSIEVGHVISVAGFFSAREVLKTYRLAGILPIIGPLRTQPWLQTRVLDQLHHKWESSDRIYRLAKETKIKITLAHATSDSEVLSHNSEMLFRRAIAGALHKESLPNIKSDLSIDRLSDGGRVFRSSLAERIQYREFTWGAHNLVQWNDELLDLI